MGADGASARAPSSVNMASFVSPSAYSRLAKCPICDRSVHKVLIESHVEICLERQASGAAPSPAGELGDRLLARDLGEATTHATTPVSAGAPGRASFVAASTVVRPGTARAATSQRDGGGGANLAARTPFDLLMGKDKGSTAGGHAGVEEKENRADSPRGGDGWRKGGGGPDGEAAPASASSVDASGKRSTLVPLQQWFKRSDDRGDANLTPAAKRARVSDPGEGRARNGGSRAGKGDAEEGDKDANDENEEEDAGREDPVVTAEALGDGGLVNFPLRVMSGSHDACGICLETFTEGGEAPVLRHVFWPCQHVRQCGDCALRIWQVPKAKRRCPWCKSKIDIRPRPFKPFL